MHKAFFIVLLSSVFGLLAPAHAGPHTHGLARMNIVQDGAELQIEWLSPMDNLLGFEHRPRSDAQRQAVRIAMARLNAPERFLLLPPAAGCVLASTQIDLPWTEIKHATGKAERNLGAEHEEIRAQYRFQCRRPGALRQIDVRLFDVFPRLLRIDGQRFTARGQGSIELHPQRTVLAF